MLGEAQRYCYNLIIFIYYFHIYLLWVGMIGKVDLW